MIFYYVNTFKMSNYRVCLNGRFLYCAGHLKVEDEQVQRDINQRDVHLTICLLGEITPEIWEKVKRDLAQFNALSLRVTGEDMFGPNNNVPVIKGEITLGGKSYTRFGKKYGVPSDWMIVDQVMKDMECKLTVAEKEVANMKRSDKRKYWKGQTAHVRTKTERVHQYLLEMGKNGKEVKVDSLHIQEVGKKVPLHIQELKR